MPNRHRIPINAEKGAFRVMRIYDELRVKTVVNACGPKTTYPGVQLPPVYTYERGIDEMTLSANPLLSDTDLDIMVRSIMETVAAVRPELAVHGVLPLAA